MSRVLWLTISRVLMLFWPGPQVAPTGRQRSSMSVWYDFSRASMFFIMPAGVSSFSYSSVTFSGQEAKPMNHLSRPARLAPGHRRAVEVAFGVDVVVDVVDPQLDRLVQHGDAVLDARSAVAAQGDLGDHEAGLAQLR